MNGEVEPYGSDFESVYRIFSRDRAFGSVLK